MRASSSGASPSPALCPASRPTLSPARDANRRQAALWLALATCAVAISGLFAILIALARVPALGTLFPGPQFYRVALTLHVNLSQGVWFMAFAGVLWSLASRRAPGTADRVAWLAAALGAAGMALSVGIGAPTPLMSNYLPVLDSPVFLSALCLFGFGVGLQSLRAAAAPTQLRPTDVSGVQTLALRLAAVGTIAVFVLLLVSGSTLEPALAGEPYFEALFWGGGHVWQFVLVGLLMACWLELAPEAARRLPTAWLRVPVLVAALPVLLGALTPLLHAPGSPAYAHAFTWLMKWTSWEAPVALGTALLVAGRLWRPAPGFGLSLLLFCAGLLLGTAISGQTTLITAHYHGTIGAVTLAFMAASFALLPRLGIHAPSSAAIRVQLGLYGYGVLLMMAGLAGAGLMGAPRKTPGELAVSWSVETVSRICLGLGGLLATLGILMFAFLLVRRVLPVPAQPAYSR